MSELGEDCFARAGLAQIAINLKAYGKDLSHEEWVELINNELSSFTKEKYKAIVNDHPLSWLKANSDD